VIAARRPGPKVDANDPLRSDPARLSRIDCHGSDAVAAET
jgi:hypothetical protein